MKNHYIFRAFLLLFFFAIAISFPLINNRIEWIKDIESFENRKMASEPSFNVKLLDPFPAAYDTFYNDNFNLRNRLIRYHNLYNILVYRKSPQPDKFIIGKDNWLFPVGDEMDSYLGKNRLTPEELKGFKEELEYRQKYLAERNCKFYFMVVPCKASIHTEKIGYEYFRMNSQSWGEQLNDYLKTNSTVNIVDGFAALKEKRKEHDLYYHLDNHWNKIGALYTTNEIIKEMKKDFPDLRPLNMSDYKIVSAGLKLGNIQRMMGNLNVFKEEAKDVVPLRPLRAKEVAKVNYKPVEGFAYPWEFEFVRAVPDSTLPSLLMITDSFGESIFPFLAENFSRTVKIFDAWQYKLNENIVEAERPDAMIIMIDEPILRNFLQHGSKPLIK